jgi:hypothetical protein
MEAAYDIFIQSSTLQLRISDLGLRILNITNSSKRLFNPQSSIHNRIWVAVYGELLTFDDPETGLLAIDRLEGFHPGGPCLYRRVLASAQVLGIVLPAWLYAVGDRRTGGFRKLSSGVWR